MFESLTTDQFDGRGLVVNLNVSALDPHYHAKWIAKRRSAFFVDKGCVACGSREDLELDHIDPATKLSNAIWSWRAERREAEIKKCQVLCYKCHTTKSAEFCRERFLGVPNLACRKLTMDQVAEIKKLLSAGCPEREVASQFKVGKTTIHSIKTGESYTASRQYVKIRPCSLTGRI